MMTANELKTLVLLGGGNSQAAREATAPLMALVTDALGICPHRVTHCGDYIRVSISTDIFPSTKASWAAIWVVARGLRAALPATYRVGKPQRSERNGGTFTLRDDFVNIYLA